MTELTDEIRKQLGIPKGADILYIDLDETKVIEEVTHGWTDTQLLNKTAEEFDAMISQREAAVAKLQATVDSERAEISKLRDLRARRLTLGD